MKSLIAFSVGVASCVFASDTPSILSFDTTKATLLSTSAPNSSNFATMSAKMSSTNTESYPDEAVISLPIKGENLEITLEKSQLLAPKFHEKVLSYDPRTGAPIETDVAVMAAREGDSRNCYYHGHIKGHFDSIVALNTCNGGVSGMISLNKQMYSLERPPQTKAKAAIQSSKSLASSLSSDIRVVNVEHEHKLLGDTVLIDPIHTHNHASTHTTTHANTNITPLAARIDELVPVYDVKGERSPRWVEVVVVSDLSRAQKFGSRVSEDTLEIMNNVAAYYLKSPTKHSIRIVLKGHYIFDKANPYHAPNYNDSSTQVTGSNGLLNVFLHYMSQHQSHFPAYDVAMLLSAEAFQSNIRGLANMGSVCGHKSVAGGVNSLVYRSNVFNAVLTSHELAHTLFSPHDSQAGATECPSDKFIMGPYVTGNTEFSACSRSYFNYHLEDAYCLYNNPHAASALDGEDDAAVNSSSNESQIRALQHELAQRERGIEYPPIDINKGRIEAYDAEHGILSNVNPAAARLLDPYDSASVDEYEVKDLVIVALGSVLCVLVLMFAVLTWKSSLSSTASTPPSNSKFPKQIINTDDDGDDGAADSTNPHPHITAPIPFATPIPLASPLPPLPLSATKQHQVKRTTLTIDALASPSTSRLCMIPLSTITHPTPTIHKPTLTTNTSNNNHRLFSFDN